MTEWDVPGYVGVELLGFGAAGELWRGRSARATVALRRISGGNPQAIRAVRAAATIVRSLPSPHLIRVRTTLDVHGDDVVVLDFAEGGPLSALLARRGVLTAGEVVTAVAPLAEALGQAHAHGLVHGRLGLSSVLLTADGRPLLDGIGTVALYDPADGHDPTGALGPSADVWALGELCRLLLSGEPGRDLPTATPAGLRRAIEAATADDLRVRPSAVDLAAALLASCPAQPLPVPRVSPLDAAASGPRHTRRRRPGRALQAARIGGVFLVVVAAGWAWGSREVSQPALPAVQAPASPVNWASVVDALDAARATAFAHADPAELSAVWSPSSRQAAGDARTVTALTRQGRTAVGVRHAVESVKVSLATADRAELDVVETLGSYDVQSLSGTPVAHRATSGAGPVHFVLVRTSAGWRIEAVTPA